MTNDTIDYRAHPEHYRIGRGEAGVFHIEPYKGELLPPWTIRTPDLARESAEAIVVKYREYRDSGDFVGMDLARKYLQMGYTRARRYANHKGGRKHAPDGTELPRGTGNPAKAEVAALFRAHWRAITDDPAYQRLKADHQRKVRPDSTRNAHPTACPSSFNPLLISRVPACGWRSSPQRGAGSSRPHTPHPHVPRKAPIPLW